MLIICRQLILVTMQSIRAVNLLSTLPPPPKETHANQRASGLFILLHVYGKYANDKESK